MKNLKHIIVLFLTVSFFYSCKSDDVENVTPNTITAGDKSFEIGNTKLFKGGRSNDVTIFQLLFTSSNLNIDNSGNFQGNGDAIQLTLFSGSDSMLEAGEYVFNNQDRQPFVLNFGVLVLGYEGDDSIPTENFSSGKVSVTIDNDIYTITIDATGKDGTKITGYYKGALTIVSFND